MYESVDWFKLVFCRKMELKWNYTSLEMLREEDGQAWNQTGAEKWKKKTKVQQPGTVRTVGGFCPVQKAWTVRTVQPCARSGSFQQLRTDPFSPVFGH